MVKIFTKPFAVNGTKETISDLSQPDGKVSYEDGFTSDYELPDADPNYRPIERSEFNGLMNAVTDAVGELQQFGFTKWQPIKWPKNARVVEDGVVYRAQMETSEPLTDGVWLSEKPVLLDNHQTITGLKQFSVFPSTPTSAPTNDYQVANKKYVDDKVASAGGGVSADALIKTKNLSDLTNKATARANLGLGTAATSGVVQTTGASTTNVMSQKAVTDAISSAASGGGTSTNAVLLTGNQTVAGTKTFTSFPVTPSSAPTANYQTANKKYVDDKVASVSGGGTSTNAVLLTGNQMIYGIKTFADFPALPAAIPTTNYQAANKKYVDDKVASVGGLGVGQTWQDMTGSRVSDIAYTNSTGKPIMVSVSYLSSGDEWNRPEITGWVNSVLVQQTAVPAGGNKKTAGSSINFLVPSGDSYRVELTGQALNPVVKWAELR